MSCTPQYLNSLRTTATCASQGLQAATFEQCKAIVGSDGASGAPFWDNDVNGNWLTSSIANWPCGCFLYLAGGRKNLFYNTASNCGNSNDYRTNDGCGCAAADCSLCTGGGDGQGGADCTNGQGVYSSSAGGCVNPGGTHYCRDPGTGGYGVSVCYPAPPSPPPPPHDCSACVGGGGAGSAG